MFRFLLPFALIVLPGTAMAQEAEPDLTLEQRMLVRCSAAFALVANGQENGNEAALTYPDVRQSGREFFVRSSARLMDEAGLTREQVAALLSEAAQDIWDNGSLDAVMPACLPLLPE